MNIIIYESDTGRVIKSVSCPEDMIELQLDSSTSYIEHEQVDDSKFYIVSETVVPRPTFSESVSGTTISNLPIPTIVIAEGTPYTITDGSAELSFSLPGIYKVRLSSFPYQDKDVEVVQP